VRDAPPARSARTVGRRGQDVSLKVEGPPVCGMREQFLHWREVHDVQAQEETCQPVLEVGSTSMLSLTGAAAVTAASFAARFSATKASILALSSSSVSGSDNKPPLDVKWERAYRG
jgi:hypothetical protein